jgi:hypothetical protein
MPVIVDFVVIRLRVIRPGVVGGRWRQRTLDIRPGPVRAEISSRRGSWREREEGASG